MSDIGCLMFDLDGRMANKAERQTSNAQRPTSNAEMADVKIEKKD
jgi:hypothetical protein